MTKTCRKERDDIYEALLARSRTTPTTSPIRDTETAFEQQQHHQKRQRQPATPHTSRDRGSATGTELQEAQRCQMRRSTSLDSMIVAAPEPTPEQQYETPIPDGHTQAPQAIMYDEGISTSIETSAPQTERGVSITLQTAPVSRNSSVPSNKRKRNSSRPNSSTPRSRWPPTVTTTPLSVNGEVRRSHRVAGIEVVKDYNIKPNAALDFEDARLYPFAWKTYKPFKTILIDRNGDGHDLHCPICYGNMTKNDELLSGIASIKRHVKLAHKNIYEREYKTQIDGANNDRLVEIFCRKIIPAADLEKIRVRDDEDDEEERMRKTEWDFETQVVTSDDIGDYERRDSAVDEGNGIDEHDGHDDSQAKRQTPSTPQTLSGYSRNGWTTFNEAEAMERDEDFGADGAEAGAARGQNEEL
ncbi:hypothetical protein BDZ85DRAFT_296019 [Elsinoe ampelina]|uniref:Uncharacterized protein n=1 Tax=Elsinoe ampelina TaxID=302913 RepID=A0A6A6GE16_9PEZI|nr:hypothetical protein BDZ85DRAFT_296019 [Elsinoe ampelina]